MVVGLFKSVPLAVVIITAGFNAVFKVSNLERVDEVTFTLESPMTITSRTPDKRTAKIYQISFRNRPGQFATEQGCEKRQLRVS